MTTMNSGFLQPYSRTLNSSNNNNNSPFLEGDFQRLNTYEEACVYDVVVRLMQGVRLP